MNIHDKARHATLERLQGRSALYNIGLEIADEAAHKKWVDVAKIYDDYAKMVGLDGQSEKSRAAQISKLKLFRKAGWYFGPDAPKVIREWRRSRRNIDYRDLLTYLSDAIRNRHLPPIP
jgi:hypothetical protein